jgi:hypothetical protein
VHLRHLAASVGSVACRVAVLPHGTPAARLSRALAAHGSPHNTLVQRLEVSPGDVLQHQILQAQLRYQPLQLRVLLLQILQPSSLIHLHPALLLAPTVIGLLHNLHFLTSLRKRLPVRNSNLNLPWKVHNLLRGMLLPSCHSHFYLFQFVASQLVQKWPAIPQSQCSECNNAHVSIRRP